MVAGASLIKKSQRYKTLFYGLRLNHPRNVALVFPVLDTMRRLIYALSIVFLADVPLVGVWILLGGTLGMLVFAMTELPWKQPIINQQYIFNEVMTYIICVILLISNGYIPAEMRFSLGYLIIGVISVFLVYNGIFMLRKVTRLLRLLFRKWRYHKKRLSLYAEARRLANIILAELEEHRINLIAQFSDSEDESEAAMDAKLQPVLKVDIIPLTTGGYLASIVKDKFKTEQNRKRYEQVIEKVDLFNF